MRKPSELKKGDTIAFVAPSGPVAEERIAPSVKAMEEFGLNVVLGKSCTAHRGYLAGDDSIRADDINNMFADKNINGIFAMRGGYGSARILDMLDYDMIKNNPKVFAGYSDITALHVVFNQICGFITYHSPMPSSEFYRGTDEYTLNQYKKYIFGSSIDGVIENPHGNPIKTFVSGEAEGTLIGGNLSLLASSIGTKYEVDTKGKILFIEEVEEEPYKIDKMLLQLKQSGKLKDAAGIIFGSFTRCEPENKDKSLTLEEIFNDLIVDEGRPTIYNASCGHSTPTMTLPMGAQARIGKDGFSILK